MEEFRELTSGMKISKHVYRIDPNMYTFIYQLHHRKSIKFILIRVPEKFSEIEIYMHGVIAHREKIPETHYFLFDMNEIKLREYREFFIRINNSEMCDMTIYEAVERNNQIMEN